MVRYRFFSRNIIEIVEGKTIHEIVSPELKRGDGLVLSQAPLFGCSNSHEESVCEKRLLLHV